MSDGVEDLEPALLTAARMLAWRRSQGQLRDFRPPRGVILTHQGTLFRALAPRWRQRPIRLAGEIRFLPGSQGEMAVMGGLGVGAPATAIAVEELAELGVKKIVAVDVCGSLSSTLGSGAVLLAEGALCGDGTSPHYAPAAHKVSAGAALLALLAQAMAAEAVPFTSGVVWSTDAPYRETSADVEEARRQGAAVVDMETAALYAAGAALGVETAAVIVVADQLLDGWQPPSDMQLVQSRLRRLGDIAKACLLA